MTTIWRSCRMTSESLGRVVSGAVIAMLFTSTLLLSFEVDAADWSSPTEISSGAWVSGSAYIIPYVSVDGSNVHVVWMDGRRTLDLDYDLYYASSPDGGATWQTDMRIDTAGFYSSRPKLVSNGTELHVVLEDEGTFWHIFSTDGGATWKNDTILSRVQSIEDFDLASEGSNLYLVWSEWEVSPQSYDFYLVRSTDFGASWSAPIFIADMWGNHAYMGVDASEGWLHMVSDGGYVRSSDGGTTWDSLNGSLGGRDVSAEGPYVHLMRGNAYQLDGYMRSEDYGDTWTPLNTSIIGKISSFEEYVHILNGSYYFLSDDRGVTFGDVGIIPDVYSVSPYCTSVAVDTAGWAHVVYLGYDVVQLDLEVFYVRSEPPPIPDFGPFPPTEPLNLTAVPGNRYVRLTWEPPAQDWGWSVTSYMIYRGLTQGEWTFLHVVGDVLSYTDNDVTNGVTYWYVVTAANRAGYGAWSTEASATPTNQHPVCSMVSPTDGATVSGALVISGTASDIDGTVERVEVRIDDGSWIVATGTESWSFDWSTTGVSNGNHTIHARSYDGENHSYEVSVSVVVDNYMPPPEKESIFLQAWFWAVVVVVILGLVLFIFLWRRKLKKNEPPPSS